MIDFTIHEFTIPWKLNQTQYLIPFGDVHLGSPQHHKYKWREFCDWAKTKQDAYFIGMGDYLELLSSSERIGINDAHLHDSTYETLDEFQMSFVHKFYEQIKFMQGKIVGLIEGNHTPIFCDGTTGTQRLCQFLKCKYLGTSSHFRLQFMDSKNNRGLITRAVLDCYAHHGIGRSGNMLGGSVNSLQRLIEKFDAQIYLMGHDHAKLSACRDRLYLYKGNGSIKQRSKKFMLVRTGSFQKGYEDGKSSFAAKHAMGPSSLGLAKLELTCKMNKHDDYKAQYVDVHVSI